MEILPTKSKRNQYYIDFFSTSTESDNSMQIIWHIPVALVESEILVQNWLVRLSVMVRLVHDDALGEILFQRLISQNGNVGKFICCNLEWNPPVYGVFIVVNKDQCRELARPIFRWLGASCKLKLSQLTAVASCKLHDAGLESWPQKKELPLHRDNALPHMNGSYQSVGVADMLSSLTVQFQLYPDDSNTFTANSKVYQVVTGHE